jgi:hypothetical protein
LKAFPPRIPPVAPLQILPNQAGRQRSLDHPGTRCFRHMRFVSISLHTAFIPTPPSCCSIRPVEWCSLPRPLFDTQEETIEGNTAVRTVPSDTPVSNVVVSLADARVSRGQIRSPEEGGVTPRESVCASEPVHDCQASDLACRQSVEILIDDITEQSFSCERSTCVGDCLLSL